MSDLISRKAAIEKIGKIPALNDLPNLKELCLERIRQVPSAELDSNCSEIPNNWIPCSERLSEPYSPSDEGV